MTLFTLCLNAGPTGAVLLVCEPEFNHLAMQPPATKAGASAAAAGVPSSAKAPRPPASTSTGGVGDAQQVFRQSNNPFAAALQEAAGAAAGGVGAAERRPLEKQRSTRGSSSNINHGGSGVDVPSDGHLMQQQAQPVAPPRLQRKASTRWNI